MGPVPRMCKLRGGYLAQPRDSEEHSPLDFEWVFHSLVFTRQLGVIYKINLLGNLICMRMSVIRELAKSVSDIKKGYG